MKVMMKKYGVQLTLKHIFQIISETGILGYLCISYYFITF